MTDPNRQPSRLDTATEGGGATGGLAAFGAAAGLGLMAVAAVILVIGGVFYIRSAKD